jgi:hypothetical protein
MWFVAGLLALAIVAAALVPRTTSNQTPPPVDTVERTTVTAEIGAKPTRARTIAARVGDHLQLTVENDRIDSVTIEGLDLTKPVDGTTPARFDTLLDRDGRFQVKLQDADKVVGVLDVKPT